MPTRNSGKVNPLAWREQYRDCLRGLSQKMPTDLKLPLPLPLPLMAPIAVLVMGEILNTSLKGIELLPLKNSLLSPSLNQWANAGKSRK
jgi:hypothetical protein